MSINDVKLTSFLKCLLIFYCCYHDLDESVIVRAASRTKGAAGVSGMDAEIGNALSFQRVSASKALIFNLPLPKWRENCAQRSLFAKTPLKKIALRPIGIGETIRRIIRKSILQIVCNDVV